MLLQNQEFAKLLEITPEQTNELAKLRPAPRTQGAPVTPPPSPEELQDSIFKILTPAQQTKANEALFQLMPNVMDSPMLNERMLAALDLTAEQKEKIKKIADDRAAEIATRLTPQGGATAGGPPTRMTPMTPEERTAFTKKFTDQMVAVLSPEQKAKAEKLTTEAADLRTKLGVGQGAQGGRQQGQQGGRQQGGGAGFVPGAGAWQPGQGAPNPYQIAPTGNFPRTEE
jgi:Spy/CpxP family protein refolding chaperone